jgi:hypothetical protein
MPLDRNDPRLKKGGRKGYELEQEQLELMRKIVSKDLSLLEKVYEGKATDKDFKTLAIVQGRVTKYLDKLHASKNSLENENGEPFILQVINYAKDNSTTPSVCPSNISVRVPTSTSTIQSGCMEQEEWQIEDPTKRTDTKDTAS